MAEIVKHDQRDSGCLPRRSAVDEIGLMGVVAQAASATHTGQSRRPMQVRHSEIAAVIRIRAVSRSCPVLRTLSAIVFISAFVLAPCGSERPQETPSISLTKISPAAQGGRERVDTISGRVRNARTKQQIVIYAYSGQW